MRVKSFIAAAYSLVIGFSIVWSPLSSAEIVRVLSEDPSDIAVDLVKSKTKAAADAYRKHRSTDLLKRSYRDEMDTPNPHYLAIFDKDGNYIVANKKTGEIDGKSVQDVGGERLKLDLRQLHEILDQHNGAAWIEFIWVNPSDQQVGSKIGYFMRDDKDKTVFVSGFYPVDSL